MSRKPHLLVHRNDVFGRDVGLKIVHPGKDVVAGRKIGNSAPDLF